MIKAPSQSRAYRLAVRVGSTAALLLATAYAVDPHKILARLARLDPAWLLLALAISVPVYLCVAARWFLVARRLEAPLRYRRAVADYYLSTFLNQVLPLGVAGDAVRAVKHGQDLRGSGDAGGRGRAVRAVVVERLAGLAVLGVAVAACGASLAGRDHAVAALGVGEAVVIAIAVTLVLTTRGRRVGGAAARALGDDARRTAQDTGLLVRVAALSVLALAGLVGMFYCAARAAGVTVDQAAVVQVTPLILGASALPLAFAGWGVREALTAATYGALGLGPATGAAVALTYGVLSLVAAAPGLVLWLVPRRGASDAARAGDGALDPAGDAVPAGDGAPAPDPASAIAAPARAHAGHTPRHHRAWELMHPLCMLAGMAAALATGQLIAFAATGIGSLAVWVALSGRAGDRLATWGNAVTGLRIAAIFALPFAAAAGWSGAALAAAVAGLWLLDGADGWVARRTGTTSATGARLDMEADAFLIMTLCLLLDRSGTVGGWVLIAGLWRYGYGLVVALVPARGEAPRSRLGRLVAGALMLCLAGALLAGPGPWAAALAGLGTAAVSLSFARSLAWSYRDPLAGAKAQSNSTSGPMSKWTQSSATASDS